MSEGDMDEERLIDRVRLLLAKAESTTPPEAVALTEHAERLMVRYGIEQARLVASPGSAVTDPIEVRRITYKGAYANVNVTSGEWVVHALGGIRALQSRHSGGKTLILIGHRRDLDRAQMLVTSLQLQAATALRTWWTQGPVERWMCRSSWERTKARRNFLASFAHTAAERVRAVYNAAVEEVAGTGTDLVLADRSAAVDDFVAERFPRLHQVRGSVYNRVSAGVAAGRQANVGGTQLSGTRGALEG